MEEILYNWLWKIVIFVRDFKATNSSTNSTHGGVNGGLVLNLMRMVAHVGPTWESSEPQ